MAIGKGLAYLWWFDSTEQKPEYSEFVLAYWRDNEEFRVLYYDKKNDVWKDGKLSYAVETPTLWTSID